MTRRISVLLAALVLAAPAAAQAPEWRSAPEQDVLLQAFDYEPETIRLSAGVPVKLRFVNQGQATLSFSAPAFFSAARMRPGDDSLVAGGRFSLRPGERRTIALVPSRGRYRARSGNLLHRLLGMSALIVVE